MTIGQPPRQEAVVPIEYRKRLRGLTALLAALALLPACGLGADKEMQLRATAFFEAGNAYSKLVCLRRAPQMELPSPGYTAVALSIPWSSDVNALVLPQRILRSEPVEINSDDALVRLPRTLMRPSNEFDPPLLPVLAAGEPDVIEERSKFLEHRERNRLRAKR